MNPSRPASPTPRRPAGAEGVKAVVHLAATPDDDDFFTKLLPNNIVGVYHILEAARLAGVRRLVLASSGQVVWHQRFTGPLPIGADVPPTPRGWYAATKVFQEAAGRAYAEAHGMSVIAARLGWCPRTREHAEELAATDWGPDVYLSPGDAGRFFALAAEAPPTFASPSCTHAAGRCGRRCTTPGRRRSGSAMSRATFGRKGWEDLMHGEPGA